MLQLSPWELLSSHGFFCYRRISMEREYLTENQVSQLIGRSISSLRNDRAKSSGLPFVKWGGKFIRYPRKDIIDFMEARKVIPENGDPKVAPLKQTR